MSVTIGGIVVIGAVIVSMVTVRKIIMSIGAAKNMDMGTVMNVVTAIAY